MTYADSKIILARAAFTALLFQGTAAYAANETVGMSTDIIAPITLTKTQDLDFGTIAPTANNGTVTIHARTGNRTGNANVTLVGSNGQRALFNLAAEPNMTVTLSSASTRIWLAGPGTARMRMVRFRVNRNNGGQRTLPRNYTVPGSGNMSIGFGARLRVGANQTPGLYSGSVDLTVDYQ